MKFAILLSLAIHGLMLVVVSKGERPAIAFKQGISPVEISGGSQSKLRPALQEEAGTIQKPKENAVMEANSDGGVVDGSALGVPPPEYPRLSRLRGEQGDVILSLKLDSENVLVSAEVATSSGFPALDRSALDCVTTHLPRSASAPTREKKIRFRFQLKRPR